MSKLHDVLCKAFPGLAITALKEWSNERGEMGVYHEVAEEEQSEIYVPECYSLAVLLSDGRLFHEDWPHSHVPMLLEDATILAEFAGAKDTADKSALPISPYTGEPYDPKWGIQMRSPGRKKGMI